MPLVRTAGTPEPDTNPVFWRCWEQLGHAVVLQACRDYASARKKLEKNAVAWQDQETGSDHYNPMVEFSRYEKFFRSKYFAYICPKYDGHTLFDRLKNGGWKTIPKGHHHYTQKHVFSVYADYYKPKANRDPRGRYSKYDYR